MLLSIQPPPFLTFIIATSTLRLAYSQDVASSTSLVMEPAECKLHSENKMITCHGVNSTQLIKSLREIRKQVVDERRKIDNASVENTDNHGVGSSMWRVVREVSYNSCVLPNLTSDTLFTPSPLDIVIIVSSGIREVNMEAFDAHAQTLVHLDLSHNLLTVLPEATANLTRLEVLDLRHNEIDHLPKGSVLINLRSLRQLYLDHNRLGQIVGAQTQLGLAMFNLDPLSESLTHLSFAHNALTVFPQLFTKPFVRLTNLDLSSNNISEVSGGMLRNTARLQQLDLSNNLLQSFMPHDFLTSIIYLNLAGNPWNCNCDSRWMLPSRLDTSTKTMYTVARPTITSPTCSFPIHLRHRKLTFLTESEVCSLHVPAPESQVVYVGDDVDGVLGKTLAFLHLLNVTTLNHQALLVSWRVDPGFYFSSSSLSDPLSWAITIQETQQDRRDAKVTIMSLERLKEERPDWKPSDYLFTEVLQGLKPETKYTICLTLIQYYYVFTHPVNCRHGTTPARIFHTTTPLTALTKALVSVPNGSMENYSVKTERVSMVNEARQVNLSWAVTIFLNMFDIPAKQEVILLRPLGWKITYRRFGEKNEEEVVLVSRGGEPVQNFTNHYSVKGLEPGTGYTFCLRSLSDQEVRVSHSNSSGEMHGINPHAQSQVSLIPRLSVSTTRGNSMQLHVDPNVHHNKTPLLSDSSEPYYVSQEDLKSQRTNSVFSSRGSTSRFQSQEISPVFLSKGSNATLPSQGSNEAFPSQGITTTFPSKGSTTASPSQGSTTASPSPGRTTASPSPGSTAAFPSQGSRAISLKRPYPLNSHNIQSFPNLLSRGTNPAITSNIPSAPSLTQSRRPPKPQYGGNFVYTSTGERIILPSTSSGPASPFNIPSVVGSRVNIGPSSRPISSSPSPVARNSRQRFIYEYDGVPTEKTQQSFTYDFTTEAVNTATSLKHQVYISETRHKRSYEENSNTLYKVNLESGIMQYCQEIVTLDENDEIPLVAIASTVSSTTTVVLVIILCCCCPRKCRHKMAGWSGKPTYTARKITGINAPSPIHVFSGNDSILTGSVISEDNGELKQARPLIKISKTPGGNINIGHEANDNLMKIERSLSVTSSFGYLTPLQIPIGLIHDPVQALRNAQSSLKSNPNYVRDHLQQHKDLREFHPGYDIPPASSNKPLFGYDYPHPVPVNPLEIYGNINGRLENPNKLPVSLPASSVSKCNASNENGRYSERHSEINLNIPFDQKKSSDLNKTFDLNSSPDSNKSLEYNYIIPENKGTYTKKLTKSHGKITQKTALKIMPDGVCPESKDYSDHQLPFSEHHSHSAPDLDNDVVIFNDENSRASGKATSVILHFPIGDHTSISLQRLSKKEQRKSSSILPHTLAECEKVDDYASFLPENNTNHQEEILHTKVRPSLGEVVLTGGTLIEVPEGYVVPKPPKPAHSVTPLVPDNEVEYLEMPETVSYPAPKTDIFYRRRSFPVIRSDGEKGESKIIQVMTPELEPNRIIIRTGQPV